LRIQNTKHKTLTAGLFLLIFGVLSYAVLQIPAMSGILDRLVGFGFCQIKNFRGKKFTIGESCHIWFPWYMTIGPNSHVSRNCQINGPFSGDITIGSNVMIGPYVMCTAVIHNFSDTNVPIKNQGMSSKPIIIEDDVWIGGHSVILPGVRIGKGAIIGADR